MDFLFTINKNLLTASALFSQRGQNLKGWKDLKNKLWDKYRAPYEFFLHNDSRTVFSSTDLKESVNKITDQVKPFFEECQASEEYQQLLKEAEEYRNWLESEWDKKKEHVLKELGNILKIKLPNNTFTVQVVAPSVGGGKYLGNNTIFWGHTEDWDNYSIVYLIHEALHEIIGTQSIEHAVIELIADNELRIRLNSKGEYFYENGNQVGHDYLSDLEKKLVPYWDIYLNNPSTNIFEFLREIKALNFE
jgi:hypothetical protein